MKTFLDSNSRSKLSMAKSRSHPIYTGTILNGNHLRQTLKIVPTLDVATSKGQSDVGDNVIIVIL